MASSSVPSSVFFLVHGAVLGSILGAAVHDGTILGLVAGSQLQQFVHNIQDSAGFVQGALVEPDIVIDAVLAQVALEGGNVLGQGVIHQSVLQGLKGFAGKRASSSSPEQAATYLSPLISANSPASTLMSPP